MRSGRRHRLVFAVGLLSAVLALVWALVAGDMPISLQAHLLRVLQERQVTPLGSAKSVSVDVTLVCATHRNLREMIEQKAFREDLYYRLNGLAVQLEKSDL